MAIPADHGGLPQQSDQPTTNRKVTGRAYSYLVAAVAGLGGLLFGYDTGVISGAILYITPDFHLTSQLTEVAVSSVLIGAIPGAIIGGKLSDALGRKKTLIILALIFSVGAIFTAFAPTLGVFLACRVIVGFATGAASFIAPIYITELAPPDIRGSLVTFSQLATTIGIAVSYWVDLAFAHADKGWRPMFAVAVIPAIALGLGMLFLTESPRWLASKGHWDAANQALDRVVQGPEKTTLVNQLHTSLEEGKHVSVRDLLRPGLRLALLVGIGLAVSQQLVGINTVIYYAPTIFGFAGFTDASSAILATSVVGVVNVLATVLSLVLVDRVGRRPLLLGGLIGIGISLILMGLVFSAGSAGRILGFVVLLCLLGYIIAFGVGIGAVYWVISSEIFPTRLRGIGAGISTTANWSTNLLVSITFLTLVGTIGISGTFWLYASFAVAAFLFCWFLVPETKGKPLENIERYWEQGRQW